MICFSLIGEGYGETLRNWRKALWIVWQRLKQVKTKADFLRSPGIIPLLRYYGPLLQTAGVISGGIGTGLGRAWTPEAFRRNPEGQLSPVIIQFFESIKSVPRITHHPAGLGDVA